VAAYGCWPATSGGRLAAGVAFIARAGLGLGGAEGVGDALVGGVGLPVDAVGVNLEQDRDAVPGPAGDLVCPNAIPMRMPVRLVSRMRCAGRQRGLPPAPGAPLVIDISNSASFCAIMGPDIG
jgi:hypothetical protein